MTALEAAAKPTEAVRPNIISRITNRFHWGRPDLHKPTLKDIAKTGVKLSVAGVLLEGVAAGCAPGTQTSNAAGENTPMPTITMPGTMPSMETPGYTPTPGPTFNISTPKTEYTPGSVSIPLKEILNQTTWPQKITDAQLEAAIKAVSANNLSPVVTTNFAKKMAMCEKGDMDSMDRLDRESSCKPIAGGMLEAWNKGDPNAEAAFRAMYAYMVAPGYGFDTINKPFIDSFFMDLLTNLKIPYN